MNDLLHIRIFLSLSLLYSRYCFQNFNFLNKIYYFYFKFSIFFSDSPLFILLFLSLIVSLYFFLLFCCFFDHHHITYTLNFLKDFIFEIMSQMNFLLFQDSRLYFNFYIIISFYVRITIYCKKKYYFLFHSFSYSSHLNVPINYCFIIKINLNN